MGTYRGRRHAMGLPARGQRTRTQVRVVPHIPEEEHGWRKLLMATDCDCTTTEQDRTWWYWTSVHVRWEQSYTCIILYSLAAQSGVCNPHRRNIMTSLRPDPPGCHWQTPRPETLVPSDLGDEFWVHFVFCKNWGLIYSAIAPRRAGIGPIPGYQDHGRLFERGI